MSATLTPVEPANGAAPVTLSGDLLRVRLRAGAERRYAVRLSALPTTLAPGEYRLTVNVDAGNGFDEFDEFDNSATAAHPFRVAPSKPRRGRGAPPPPATPGVMDTIATQPPPVFSGGAGATSYGVDALATRAARSDLLSEAFAL